MEHQEQDGTLKPPSSQEQTQLPVEGLAQQPMDMRRLTLNEADTLRANRAFNEEKNPLPQFFLDALNNRAYELSMFIIDYCPEGKERSQALGQVHAAVLWAKEAGIKNG